MIVFFFFFSSRRRHTRFKCDWSSDVCSSDLPVKSMGGERLEVATLGWHGMDGDRRLAFRRIDDRSAFPWLSASKLPGLLLFAPQRHEDGAQGDLPTHIRTPDAEELPGFGEDVARG